MNQACLDLAKLPSEFAVSQYLTGHPDFFSRHSALLASLAIPHPTGGAISLLEQQIKLLRTQKVQLELQLQALLEAGRENEHRLHGLHQIALRLFSQPNVDDLLCDLSNLLVEHFHAEYIAIRIEDRFHPEPVADWCYLPTQGVATPPGVLFVSPDDAILAGLDNLINTAQAVCGTPRAEILTALYGVQAAQVRSAALIPLHARGVRGVLALGSANSSRFRPELSNLFLSYLGRLISLALRNHPR
jgi:uncharacterized protein YigA (DUF484 family)